MHGGDAARKVAHLHLLQPGIADHLGELGLGREAADAFGQIAIGCLRPCATKPPILGISLKE